MALRSEVTIHGRAWLSVARRYSSASLSDEQHSYCLYSGDAVTRMGTTYSVACRSTKQLIGIDLARVRH
jgi:hypothetical protein